MTQEWTYDLFVSYADADREWVEGYLLDALKVTGVNYSSEENFKLGVFIPNEFERLIKESKQVLLILSSAYLADPKNQFVNSLSEYFGLETDTWPVIPLYLESNLKVPTRLEVRKGLDAYTSEQRKKAIERLCEHLDLDIPTHAKIPQCPYPGMSPFTEENSDLFFGRTDEIGVLVNKLRSSSFLPVIGASGSGKSSLVLAGLIPALRKSQFLGSGEWLVKIIRPGAKPLTTLKSELNSNLSNPSQAVMKLLNTQFQAEKLLLVIDQFEELFTIASQETPDTQKQEVIPFEKILLELSKVKNCYVVLTVRSDFYSNLMESSLWYKIQSNRFEIVPLNQEGLRKAIVQPAGNVSVFIQSALVERLVADSVQEKGKGILPLLQETLVLLWQYIERRYLPLDAYNKLTLILPSNAYGYNPTGLEVAIALKADAALGGLDNEEQAAIARRIFLRLIQFGEGRPDTRRQQRKSSLGDESALFEQTLNHLVDSRLLTLSGEEKIQDKQVDIAHEALISGWPTLQQWISDRREAEQTRRRLANKAQEWLNLNKEGGLLDAVELKEAKRWLATSDATELGYDQSLTDLVDVSQADLEEKERKKKAQEQRELNLTTDKLKLAILSSVDNLTASAEYAHQLGSDIEAVEKSIEAGKLLKDPLLGNEDEIETKKMRILINLNQLIYGFRERRIFTGHTDRVWGLNFSPDDQKLVSTSADGSMRLWSLNNGELIQTIYQQDGGVSDAIFNKKGDLLISLIPSLKFKTIQSWNLNESKFLPSNKPLIPEDVFPEENQVRNIAFSPNNKIIAFDYGRQIKLWNFKEKPIYLYPIHLEKWSFNLTPNPSPYQGEGSQLNKENYRFQLRLGILNGIDAHNDNINGIDFSPNNRILASAGGDGFIKVWDLKTKILYPFKAQEKDVVFSSVKFIDKETIVFSDTKGKIIVWNFYTDKKRDLVDKKNGDKEAVNTLAVSPDRDHNFVASGSRDGSIKIWDRKNSKYINGHNGSSLAIN